MIQVSRVLWNSYTISTWSVQQSSSIIASICNFKICISQNNVQRQKRTPTSRVSLTLEDQGASSPSQVKEAVQVYLRTPLVA
ncbi:hypothetical protein SDJN03_26776, partial [Cucurbita argyrosperma subsp. sororia]